MYRTSDEGIKFIGSWEGLFRVGGSAKYAPKTAKLSSEDKNKIYEYVDPIGLPTIGYGHLLTEAEKKSGNIVLNGKVVNYKNGITHDQVIELKRQDLVRFESALNKFVKVPLNQEMVDALISWAFNVGAGRLDPTGSTLVRLLNQGKYRDVLKEFPKWNKAGGKVIQGLTNRRNAEADLFLKGIKKMGK